MTQPAVVRFLASGPTGDRSQELNDEDNDQQNQENGQLGATESTLGGKLQPAKEELKAVEGKLETVKEEMNVAEGKLETAKEELKAAEGKLEAAKEEMKAAEGKLEAATDPVQKALAQKAYDREEKAYELAVKGVDTAREGVNRAGRAVDFALDTLQRAGAGFVGAPTPLGTQGASQAKRSGTRPKPLEPFWKLLRGEMDSLLGADRKRIEEWQRVYWTSLSPATSWQGADGRHRLLSLMKGSNLAIIDGALQKLGEEPYKFLAQDISAVFSKNLAEDASRKDLVCLVRGTGTGKTRLLEECRLQLLRVRPDGRVRIPLAATFNGYTTLSQNEVEGAVAELEQIDARTTLALALRLAASWYCWDFELVKRATQSVLETSNFSSQLTAVEIMTQLLAMVISDLLPLHTSRDFEFVLMVDETLRLQRLFERLHANGAAPADEHVCSSVFKAFGALQPVVNTSKVNPSIFKGFANQTLNVNASLVVSSLQFVPEFSTNSGRRVTRLPMADRLPVEDIVERWWKVDALTEGMEEGSDNLKASATALAAALCTLPRAVEAVGFKLDEWLLRREGSFASAQELCTSMWVEAETALSTRYTPKERVQEDVLFPALFQRQVSTTSPRVAGLIEDSVYVNVPEPGLTTMVPEVNIAFISAAGRSSQGEVWRALRDFPKMSGGPFRTVDEGVPLEFALARMLLVRMAVAVQGVKDGDDALLWTEVLAGFKDNRLKLGDVIADRGFSRAVSWAIADALRDLPDKSRAVPSSRKRENPETFFSWFDRRQGPCVIPRVADGEAFDLLVLLEPPGSDPFVVFYDCKAIFEVGSSLAAEETAKRLGDFDQLRWVAKIVEGAKARPGGEPANKLVRALRAGRWHMVYATTLSQNSAVEVPPEFEEHCSVMRLEELQMVLGPAFPVFDAFWRSIRR